MFHSGDDVTAYFNEQANFKGEWHLLAGALQSPPWGIAHASARSWELTLDSRRRGSLPLVEYDLAFEFWWLPHITTTSTTHHLIDNYMLSMR